MSQGIQKLTVGVDLGIVDHSIAIVPWSSPQAVHHAAMVDLQVLVGLVKVEQLAEVLGEAFVEVLAEAVAEASVEVAAEQLAEASVVGR